jgi:YfiH family protein
MIRPEGLRGAAFGTAADGDGRVESRVRTAIASGLGNSAEWAYAHQVHGSDVLLASAPGLVGRGDALVTTSTGLTLCVGTADCVPVIVEGATSVAAIHAGWRGVVGGVVTATMRRMRELGDTPLRAAIGPGIGPCCYEVSDDVLSRLAPYAARTSWGTTSVDLGAAVGAQLGEIETWRSQRCTHTDPSLHSHRRDGTRRRQVALAWLPQD